MKRRSLVIAVLLNALGVGSALAQDIWATPAGEQRADATPAPASEALPPAPESAPAPAPESVPVAGAPEVPSGATYGERVTIGLRQIVLRDFDAAIATLRAAAQLEPASPAAFCHLGDAELAKGSWVEAKAAFDSCARFAGLAREPRYTTLALVGAARVAELSQASLTEKRDAYRRLQEGSADATAKAVAAERLSAYEAMIALDAAYAPVRQRIVQRASVAGR